MLSKYAAPVAALAASVAAQSSCSFTATTVSDANNAVTSCTAISGDVHFVMGAANPTVTMAAKSITGKLSYEGDSTVSAFYADQLSSVGDVSFTNCSSLNSVSFKALTESGDMQFVDLGGLSSITTGSQYGTAGNITISNTQLSALDAFKTLTMITGLTVQGNLDLANISMNINKVGTIDVGNNEVANQGLAVTFDNLTSADSIIVRNASSVSFASLGGLTGPFQMISNTFQNFAAPNLTYSGLVTFQNNNKLTNISLPSLTTLNGTGAALTILNNTALQNIGGFPQLTEIDGALTYIGSFTNVSNINQFKKITGAVSVGTTSDQLDSSVCNSFQSLHDSRVFNSKLTCVSKTKSASTTSGGVSGGSSSNSGSGTSSSSAGAAGTIEIPALPSLSLGLGAFLLQYLLSF